MAGAMVFNLICTAVFGDNESDKAMVKKLVGLFFVNQANSSLKNDMNKRMKEIREDMI